MDGGPDRLTTVTACIVHSIRLGFCLCAVRTPPHNSWKNTADSMSTLNLALQDVGIARSKTTGGPAPELQEYETNLGTCSMSS